MDKNYGIKLRSETITQSCTLNDTIYGGWLAQNIGSAPVSVYGIELLPTEGLSSKDIVPMNPGDIWQEPISIVVQPGGALRLLRSIAKPLAEEPKKKGGNAL